MRDKNRATDKPGHSQGDPGPASPDDIRRVTKAAPRRTFWTGLTIGAVLAVATALFIIQNGASTGLHWLFWDFTAPLWLFLLASAASGAILTLLAQPLARRARARAAERRVAAERLGHRADSAQR